jgi:hypothetical protein
MGCKHDVAKDNPQQDWHTTSILVSTVLPYTCSFGRVLQRLETHA